MKISNTLRALTLVTIGTIAGAGCNGNSNAVKPLRELGVEIPDLAGMNIYDRDQNEEYNPQEAKNFIINRINNGSEIPSERAIERISDIRRKINNVNYPTTVKDRIVGLISERTPEPRGPAWQN